MEDCPEYLHKEQYLTHTALLAFAGSGSLVFALRSIKLVAESQGYAAANFLIYRHNPVSAIQCSPLPRC